MGVLVLLVAACAGKSGPAAPGDAPDAATGGQGGSPADARVEGPADARVEGPADARADTAIDAAAMADAGLAAGSLCAGAGLAVCEGFEATAPGALPQGWARRQGYGGKSMAVAADEKYRGQRALKIEGGLNGSQFLEWKGTLGPLAASHWGRIFFKVKTPAPWPTAGVLHGDIIQHLGPRATGGTLGVRWGIVENTEMKFQWIFNVQPSQAQEWGDGTAYDYRWPGTWQCLEWRYDQPSQQGMLWIDGQMIPIQVGKNHPPEIPVFTSLGVGWSNYQNAPGEGFVVWIDEVAFDGARIGCAK
jgi:hypothetical protein